MLLCRHSMVSDTAPAKLAASGCAPPMPPSPALKIHRPASEAAVMLAPGGGKGLVGALPEPLAAVLDPTARRHLAVHEQALLVERAEMLPIRPPGHQVGIGQQHARRVG